MIYLYLVLKCLCVLCIQLELPWFSYDSESSMFLTTTMIPRSHEVRYFHCFYHPFYWRPACPAVPFVISGLVFPWSICTLGYWRLDGVAIVLDDNTRRKLVFWPSFWNISLLNLGKCMWREFYFIFIFFIITFESLLIIHTSCHSRKFPNFACILPGTISFWKRVTKWLNYLVSFTKLVSRCQICWDNIPGRTWCEVCEHASKCQNIPIFCEVSLLYNFLGKIGVNKIFCIISCISIILGLYELWFEKAWTPNTLPGRIPI